MVDPLSDIISVLRPRTVFGKSVTGAGSWAVRYSEFGDPSFCAVLEGSCLLVVDGESAVRLEAGDFILMPATPGFTMSSFDAPKPTPVDSRAAAADPQEEVRHGDAEGQPEVRLLGGYFALGSPDDQWLLASMLPRLVHIRGADRLTLLVRLVASEASGRKAGRDFALARLVELLLVEALRSMQGDGAPPGLLRGLGDARLAAAMRDMHAEPARPWTIDTLAGRASLSRSAFFDRFTRAVGLAPMEYLIRWRMALAKDLLRRGGASLADIAERVGYGSASAFSTAFSRHVGVPPGRYAREA